jgi:hypothetical protein
MKLKVGDLVRHRVHSHMLGVVLMVNTTLNHADVCDVLVILNAIHPTSVGTVKYLNQSYWEKVGDKD